MTEFEKQVAANLSRADVQRMNKELQRNDGVTPAVQILNNTKHPCTECNGECLVDGFICAECGGAGVK